MLIDIVLVSCPIDGTPKLVSHLIPPKYPSNIKKNIEFKSWVKTLKSSNLKPEYIILDAVARHKVSLLIDSYSDLFKSWNIILFNHENIRSKTFNCSLIGSNAPDVLTEDYYLDDLPEIKTHIDQIANRVVAKNYREKELVLEILLFCYWNVISPLDQNLYSIKQWNALSAMPIQKIFEIGDWKNKPDVLKQILLVKKNMGRKTIFDQITEYAPSEIINALNLIFVGHQIRILFNKPTWVNLYYISESFHGLSLESFKIVSNILPNFNSKKGAEAYTDAIEAIDFYTNYKGLI